LERNLGGHSKWDGYGRKKNIPQSSMVGVAYSWVPHKVKALFSMAMQAR
jgi:hypothetical protein